ncbi:ABC transporter substrate-binding protein [Cellulomonas sp. JZ18]|uniref:ABC transporter substrate-binding protein n=1 Tax=Cellulomonas sp. JZ18 TaxID=2654191 RepID=UPI0012D3FA06|nr:ABC transporter substrate-binding protein [Cellulomonas sp. JZ18]QGQ19414.1 ABC transporter substrate-binding protein [Cellulomonas sp. JZ18]
MTHPRTARTRLPATGGAVLLLALAACSTPAAGDADAAPGGALTVEDCGAEVTLDARPQSVMTVGTAAVALLDAAGAADRITARSGEFGAPLPADLQDPPADDLVVDPSDPTTEAVLTAAPDVVLGYGLFAADPDQVRAAGTELLTVQGECGHDASTDAPAQVTLATVGDDVRRLGTVFGTEAVAEAAADALDARVAKVRRDATGDTAAWLYFFSSSDPLSGYGGTGMPHAVLEAAGLENVLGDQQDAYLTVAVESLLAEQPDWVVLSYGLYGESEEDARAALLAQPGVDRLTAVQEGRVVLLPGDASAPSPAAVDGLERLVDATR